MENQILKLLGRKKYLPSNIPELLEQLKLQPSEQQNLQRVLKELEKSGQVASIKGTRLSHARPTWGVRDRDLCSQYRHGDE